MGAVFGCGNLATFADTAPAVGDAAEVEAGQTAAVIDRLDPGSPLSASAVRATSAALAHILANPDDEMPLAVTANGEPLDCAVFHGLLPGGWLTGKMVDVYKYLIELRSREDAEDGTSPLRCVFFKSYFCEALMREDYDYDFVSRWSRRRPTMQAEATFMPCSIGTSHWVLAVVRPQIGAVEMLDWLGGTSERINSSLCLWARNETKHAGLPTRAWTVKAYCSTTPQQKKGNDCCVLMLRTVGFLARGHPLRLLENDMNYYRRRIAAELLLDLVCRRGSEKRSRAPRFSCITTKIKGAVGLGL